MMHDVCTLISVESLKCHGLQLHSCCTCSLFTLSICSCLFYKSQAQKFNWDEISIRKLLLHSPLKTLFGTKQLLNPVILIELWRRITSLKRTLIPVTFYIQKTSCGRGQRWNIFFLEHTDIASPLYTDLLSCLFCGEKRKLIPRGKFSSVRKTLFFNKT